MLRQVLEAAVNQHLTAVHVCEHTLEQNSSRRLAHYLNRTSADMRNSRDVIPSLRKMMQPVNTGLFLPSGLKSRGEIADAIMRSGDGDGAWATPQCTRLNVSRVPDHTTSHHRCARRRQVPNVPRGQHQSCRCQSLLICRRNRTQRSAQCSWMSCKASSTTLQQQHPARHSMRDLVPRCSTRHVGPRDRRLIAKTQPPLQYLTWRNLVHCCSGRTVVRSRTRQWGPLQHPDSQPQPRSPTRTPEFRAQTERVTVTSSASTPQQRRRRKWYVQCAVYFWGG